MDIQEKEWGSFVEHLKTKGVVKIGLNALGVITNLVREGGCTLGYNDLELMWETWRDAKAQTVPEGFILVKKTNRIGNPDVDFSQAPRWAKYWLKDGHSKKCWWSSIRPKKDMDLGCFVWSGQHYVEEAPSFGFLGSWEKSLTSKRAMIEVQEQSNDR